MTLKTPAVFGIHVFNCLHFSKIRKVQNSPAKSISERFDPRHFEVVKTGGWYKNPMRI